MDTAPAARFRPWVILIISCQFFGIGGGTSMQHGVVTITWSFETCVVCGCGCLSSKTTWKWTRLHRDTSTFIEFLCEAFSQSSIIYWTIWQNFNHLLLLNIIFKSKCVHVLLLVPLINFFNSPYLSQFSPQLVLPHTMQVTYSMLLCTLIFSKQMLIQPISAGYVCISVLICFVYSLLTYYQYMWLDYL